MNSANVSSIINSSEFKELIKERRRVVFPLLALILIAYFSFILTVAFDPTALGTPVGEGTTSIGIYLGIGLLLLSFILVGLYLRIRDGRIKTLIQQIHSKYN